MSNEYEKRIELFRKFFLFTREDIVKSINLLIEHTESYDEDFDVSRVTQERRITILRCRQNRCYFLVDLKGVSLEDTSMANDP